MVLTVMSIAAVTPRGGPEGTPITVTGLGFGIVAGTIVFDPQGVNIAATPLTWVDDEITFNVPAGIPLNHTATLVISKPSGTDSTTIPFWIPAASAAADELDYGYPADEAGPNQDVDDPRAFSARDFNRIIDRVKGLGGSVAIIQPKTADFQITDELLGFFTNEGAVGEVAIGLPLVASLGPPTQEYRFGCVEPQYLRIVAPPGSTISLGTSTCAPGGFVRSNLPDSTVRLVRATLTKFVSEGLSGEWTVDS